MRHITTTLAIPCLAAALLSACTGASSTTTVTDGPTTATAAEVATTGTAGANANAAYDPNGLKAIGFIKDGALVQDDDGTGMIAWTTNQIEAAAASSDCGTLARLHDYVSNHPEIEHDGPLATYTQYQLTRLGC